MPSQAKPQFLLTTSFPIHYSQLILLATPNNLSHCSVFQ